MALTHAVTVELLRQYDEYQRRIEEQIRALQKTWLDFHDAKVALLREHAVTCPIDNTPPDLIVNWEQAGHA